MLGPEGLAAAITTLLQDQISAEVAVLTDALGPLADGTGLPDVEGDPPDAAAIDALVVPRLIVPAPPDDVTNVEAGDWPFLAVSVQRVQSLRRLDLDPYVGSPAGQIAGPVFEVTYQARIFTWVRADGYTQTKAVRDRLILAVRHVVLRTQKVTDAIRLVEQSLTEEYSPVGIDTTLGATIGAGYTQAQWRAQETLPTTTFGPAEEITTTATVMT